MNNLKNKNNRVRAKQARSLEEKLGNFSKTLFCLLFYAVLALVFVNCPSSGGTGNAGGNENEENGNQYSLSETHDEVRNGLRLILNYDANTGMFVGTTMNTTSASIACVRVEVHLSNGTELGPTPVQAILAAGATLMISLDASNEVNFDRWSAHPENGCGGGGGDGD